MNFIPLSIKLQENSSILGHYIYYRKHTGKKKKKKKGVRFQDDVEEEKAQDALQDEISNKRLFVTNIPKIWNWGNLMQTFIIFGKVETVMFLDDVVTMRKMNKSSTRSAYVNFIDEESVIKALKYNGKHIRQPYEELFERVGIAKWIKQLQEKPDVEQLKGRIDRFMEIFDEREKKELEQIQSGEPIVDDEGWITVKRTTKKPVLIKTTDVQKRGKKRRSETQLLNFYKFQKREREQKRIALLRAKFNSDKDKINKMKQQRKFRPY